MIDINEARLNQLRDYINRASAQCTAALERIDDLNGVDPIIPSTMQVFTLHDIIDKLNSVQLNARWAMESLVQISTAP